MMNLSLALTPSGHLRLEEVPEAEHTLSEATTTSLRRAFGQSSAEGLLLLASKELGQELPAEFVFWRGLSRRFFERVCHLGEAALERKATYTSPFQYSEGIAYVIVNGEVVLDQGKHTGARPGRALRHGRP